MAASEYGAGFLTSGGIETESKKRLRDMKSHRRIGIPFDSFRTGRNETNGDSVGFFDSYKLLDMNPPIKRYFQPIISKEALI